MISLEDCLALCGLTKDEVLALAEHEHIPDIAATALGQYLLNQPNGCKTIRRHDRRRYWLGAWAWRRKACTGASSDPPGVRQLTSRGR